MLLPEADGEALVLLTLRRVPHGEVKVALWKVVLPVQQLVHLARGKGADSGSQGSARRQKRPHHRPAALRARAARRPKADTAAVKASGH